MDDLNPAWPRQPCPDDEFITDLGLADGTLEATLALAVRRTLARFADLPPDSISAHDAFAAEDGPGWWFDDSLDTVDFVMTLEDEIGHRIPDRVAERLVEINQLDRPHPLLTVADLTLSLARRLAGWLAG